MSDFKLKWPMWPRCGSKFSDQHWHELLHVLAASDTQKRGRLLRSLIKAEAESTRMHLTLSKILGRVPKLE